MGRLRLGCIGLLALPWALLVSCGGDECVCDDASAPDAGPDAASTTGNPTGEFANTLIRGRPPGSAYSGNTSAAVEEAAEAGFAYVEIDVRLTVDGRLLPCRHDDLATFSNCRGRVSESTVAELAACTTTSDAPAPLVPLDDALAQAPFRGVYLDLKSTETEPFSTPAELVDALGALADGMDDPSVLVAMTYQRDVADALLAAGTRTALKGYPDDALGTLALLDGARDAGAEMICVNVVLLDDEVGRRAEEDGVWLLPWARPEQVTAGSMCRLREWRAGGLISEIHETVEQLLRDGCE